MNAERRFLSGHGVSIETRADGKRVIQGYGAVFFRAGDPGTEFQLFDRTHERVMPCAFDKAIKDGEDVRATFNHSPDMILGRVANGTLRLTTDARGLKYEIDPPDTQAARDLLTSIGRGDVTGSSFGFKSRGQAGQCFTQDGMKVIRELRDVQLFDVGPVTFPAYQGTEACLRSADVEAARADLAAWEATRQLPGRLAQYQARAAEVSLRKAPTQSVGGKEYPADDFAYTPDPELSSTWKFPIFDASHAQNALGRWNQADIPARDKPGVLRKILAACKKFDIDTTAFEKEQKLSA